MREVQAAGTLMVKWIPDEYNNADLLTKTTITGNMRHGMAKSIFYNKSVGYKGEKQNLNLMSQMKA